MQSLVELGKYAEQRFASKGASPTEEETEEAEIIGGGIKASMGILMDTATGLKEGRREMFSRSPSRPAGIGLGGSTPNLGSSDPPAFGHRRSPSYAAMQKTSGLGSSSGLRSQSPAVSSGLGSSAGLRSQSPAVTGEKPKLESSIPGEKTCAPFVLLFVCCVCVCVCVPSILRFTSPHLFIPHTH